MFWNNFPWRLAVIALVKIVNLPSFCRRWNRSSVVGVRTVSISKWLHSSMEWHHRWIEHLQLFLFVINEINCRVVIRRMEYFSIKMGLLKFPSHGIQKLLPNGHHYEDPVRSARFLWVTFECSISGGKHSVTCAGIFGQYWSDSVFSNNCRKFDNSGISRTVRPMVLASAGFAAFRGERKHRKAEVAKEEFGKFSWEVLDLAASERQRRIIWAFKQADLLRRPALWIGS